MFVPRPDGGLFEVAAQTFATSVGKQNECHPPEWPATRCASALLCAAHFCLLRASLPALRPGQLHIVLLSDLRPRRLRQELVNPFAVSGSKLDRPAKLGTTFATVSVNLC